MSARPSLDDYVDVAERIVMFAEKYPEGSLQTLDWSVQEIAGQSFVVYRAAAYRTADDQRPGHGVAWEPFPGTTPYTRNSELMNAETAAWGRAIVACGIVANRKLASRQEVRGRMEEQTATDGSAPANGGATVSGRLASEKQRNLILVRAREGNVPADVLANIVLVANDQPVREFPSEDAAAEWVKKALERLPAGKVNPVLTNVAAEAR